jgi:two-component sensor histidine kinase
LRLSRQLARHTSAPRTLRFHLIAFAAILVLPLFVIAALAVSWFAQAELSANETRLQRLAQDISASVDRDVVGWLTVLDTLATSELLKAGDLEGFHSRAKAALRNRDVHVILVDRNHQQLLNTRVPFGAPLPTVSDVDSIETVFRTGRPYVSDVFTGRVSGEPVVNVEIPVFTGERAEQILLITFSPKRIGDIIAKEQLGSGWTVSVSDRKGNVLAQRLDGAQILVPQSIGQTPDNGSGVIQEAGSDETEWVEGYRWSPTTGWRTSVRVSRSLLDAPFWNSMTGLGALALLVGLASTALATVLARRISLSMSKLRLAASDLAAGRAIEATPQPIAEANLVVGAIRQAANIISDRTQALEASEEQSRRQVDEIKLLMGELAHRNKNVMAVLQSIARQILRRSTSLADFQESFDARIAALVRSNDLLFGPAGTNGSLRELVSRQLAPFVDTETERVEIGGAEVRLKTNAVQSLGLALHELATNATKYGALSGAEGKVIVRWERIGATGLDLSWLERGGPAVAEPTRSGFGQVVIERLTAQNLSGTVDYTFEPTGVAWRLRAPDVLLGLPEGASVREPAHAEG